MEIALGVVSAVVVLVAAAGFGSLKRGFVVGLACFTGSFGAFVGWGMLANRAISRTSVGLEYILTWLPVTVMGGAAAVAAMVFYLKAKDMKR